MDSAIAMMFPGQGSQFPGMLAELAVNHPLILTTFAEASDAIGEDLWALTQQGPAELLGRTENTQPALLTASVAIYRAWIAAGGPQPLVASGHSLGEYSALVAASVLTLGDATRIVRLRGQAMQAAVPEGAGAMAAILALDDDTVRQCCAEAADHGLVTAANFNAPGQVVIAGTEAAVEQAMALCKAAGARRATRLAVSVPSHCELMRDAVAPLRTALEGVSLLAPAFPVIHNVDAHPADSATAIKARLLDQLCAPVRWISCVLAMAAAGAHTVLECGPGKVLSGLVKRIDPELATAALGTPEEFERTRSLVGG